MIPSLGRLPSLIPFSDNNEVELVPSGESFLNAFIEMVDKAQKFVLLQTYIWRLDKVGMQISKAFRNAQKRGVDVYILIDGYGSSELSDDFLNELRASGVKVNFFNTFSNMEDLSLGRRLHHKILLIDNCEALIGGINLGSEYIYQIKDEGPFMDLAISIKGEAVLPIVEICRMYFNQAGPCKMLEEPMSYKFDVAPANSRYVRARASLNDAMRGVNNIGRSYNRAIDKAQFSVDIMSGYFYPSRRLLRRLVKASRRGVLIRLILSGKSDIAFSQWATHTLYEYLLKNGIEIYEWNKTVLHGKAAVVDNIWSTIGSYNLHYTSRLGNVETNIEIIDGPFAADLTQKFNEVIESGSNKVAKTFSDTYPWYFRLRDWLALGVAQFILLISVLLLWTKPSKSND